MPAASPPEIAVVVPSHDRPLRLRWLLNALEDQTLERGRWEVVVGHDSSGPETEELLRTHPLAADGTLRHATLPAGTAPPGRNRNAALALTQAELIAFTDDDCRPPEDWLANALAAARRHPGAIVQGRTIKDPDEEAALHAPHRHSQRINPPTPWCECCNIVYPRELIVRAGGFREDSYTGEDTDLAVRCKALGAKVVGAPEVLTRHAVVELTLARKLRGLWRWNDLPALFARHPELRRDLPMYIFWKHTHLWFGPLVAGAVLSRRNPLWLGLAIPYVIHAMPAHGTNTRARYRGLAEMPGQIALDAVEVAAIVTGAVRNRTLMI